MLAGVNWVLAMDANKAQQEYWSSSAGLKWIEHELALDAAMAGILEVMLDAAALTTSDHVLDVGCGTGASTICTAQMLSNGKAVGIDISKPLLDRATLRAREQGIGNAAFCLADAQTHQFPHRAYDRLVSRMGMSFFSDSVLALENLGKALKRGGRMSFVCWAAVDRNPWFRIPKEAAEKQLGRLPKLAPRAPGPNAFQDLDYVRGLMAQAGLIDIEARAIEVDLTPPGGTQGAARAASRVGPAARVVKAFNGGASDEKAIEQAVCTAFKQFDRNGNIRVPAVVNLFTCSA